MKKLLAILLITLNVITLIGCGTEFYDNKMEQTPLETQTNSEVSTSINTYEQNSIKPIVETTPIVENTTINNPYDVYLEENLQRILSLYTQETNHIGTKPQDSLVHIKNYNLNATATGTIMDYRDGYTIILTNAHVTFGDNKDNIVDLEIIFPNNDIISIDNYKPISCVDDLSIIKIKYDLEKTENYAVDLSYDKYVEKIENNNLFYYNYSNKENVIEYVGTEMFESDILYIAQDVLMFEITIPEELFDTANGCSGSGVFSSNNAFLGITCMGVNRRVSAITLERILTFLGDNL